ncbi:MAG TPA: DNA-processing protein DprA [Bacteroidales bacterium]|nr:DNA-processing protein DprA [Bacteroidales bacterium]HOU96932.1 DNA-processing protein DprA [Bacteroidales bacterium]HQG36769.1 DNA-processing protein DprA [Bacteroidales bacterium]HQG53777.1 DNA-processing protein DprA [Bacteroidales bacterium]HQJ21041.1 DNA-processing protein DprA [Bacteroidales bacterium]
MLEVPLIYKIALSLIPHVGDINARKLVSHIGSVEAIFNEPYRSLIKIPGIGSSLAKYICEKSYMKIAEKEADYVEKNGIKTFFYLDSDYPYRLRQCDDSPVLFYFKGNCNLNAPRILSIVGTRNATSRGKEICEKIITGLAANNPELIIVSGLAYGIDITAHKSAMANKLPTIGVLGHGFKTTYPSVHRAIANAMVENGGLLTDFQSDELPERNNFIKRNRIIAGISDATLIVESAITGGALITADIANSYNRDVFAVPGRIDDIWSAGCNNLIKKNKAALVERHEDIEYFLNWQPDILKQPVQRSLFNDLTVEEKMIYELLNKEGELNIDQICRGTNTAVNKLSAILLEMEFNGLIKCCPGNIYKIIS